MSDSPESERLRQVIIHKNPPKFVKRLSPSLVSGQVGAILKTLNRKQQRAVLKVLTAKDYILIQGMPGTGKTSTIVALVRILHHLGHSVLITSYTHSAVDNILLKLKQHLGDFIRLGSLNRIHLDLQGNAASNLCRNVKSLEEMSTIYESKIVGTTCLGITHPLFTKREFDFCIVDEASQVLQTACLGPLFLAKKFVLVGDPCQLPPVVRSQEAREQGMEKSLFSVLQTEENTVQLTVQYRMNMEILRLCNNLTYNNMLECGSKEVQEAVIDVKNTAKNVNEANLWLDVVLSQELNRAVLFLDTDAIMAAKEMKENGGICNDGEAGIVLKICIELLQVGVAGKGIGVISPYRKQICLIKEKLKGCNLEDIDVSTVDQFQGKDKSVILFSCVRSSQEASITTTEILQSECRLNVAITRAKHKLIVIGSQSTIKQYKPFQKFLNLLPLNQILRLPQINS